MARPSRRWRWVVGLGGAAVLVAGCAQLFGIDGPNEVPEPGDGSVDGPRGDSHAADSNAIEAASDSMPDAPPGDATNPGDSGAPFDSSLRDGPTDSTPPTDGPGPDGTSSDAPPPDDGGCAAILAAMLRAPIVPPASWAGLDLSNGGQGNYIPGSGGVTLAMAGVAQCKSYAEPTVLMGGAMPILPGYRESAFGALDAGGNGAPLLVETNLQSQAVYSVTAKQGYTGSLTFHSRSGGAYGNHTYAIAIGVVMRDGNEFPADWTWYKNDAGARVASPWANELYDGLIATFAPSEPEVADCFQATYAGYEGPLALTYPHACTFAPSGGTGSYLALRQLRLWVFFKAGTDQVQAIEGFWPGAVTTCATPYANTEAMDWSPILSGSMGGLLQSQPISNPGGLTFAEANQVECNGLQTTAPDPGFGAIEWGQSGELSMEYFLDGGLNYKLVARSGYLGPFPISDATATNNWSFVIGQPATDNGAAYAMSWSTTAAATALANAFCGSSAVDCVASGDCTFTSNDGSGHSYLGFRCRTGADQFGITFTQGTNVPTEMVSINTP